MDGLLGLAFHSISTFGDSDYSLLASLVTQRKLENSIFSLKLSSPGAEIYIGGANRMLYYGDITYTHVTNAGFWQVSMDDVRVNGNKLLENVPAVIDTGANFIFGDWDRVAEFYRTLGGTLVEHAGLGYYHMWCKDFPKMTLGLTFGGRTFKIPPEVFRLSRISTRSNRCFGAIIAQRAHTEFWNIGFTFLERVYTVFDYNNLQVGFANLV